MKGAINFGSKGRFTPCRQTHLFLTRTRISLLDRGWSRTGCRPEAFRCSARTPCHLSWVTPYLYPLASPAAGEHTKGSQLTGETCIINTRRPFRKSEHGLGITSRSTWQRSVWTSRRTDADESWNSDFSDFWSWFHGHFSLVFYQKQ